MPYGGVHHGRDEIVTNVFGPILIDVEGFTAEPDETVSLDEERVFARGHHAGRGARGRSTPASSTSGRCKREGDAIPAARRHQPFCDAVGK